LISNVSILIIEDEVLIAQDIAQKVKHLGYDVMGLYHNSERALDFLAHNSPDLILCDIRIKGQRDGIEVAEIVRTDKKIPFIFITSFADRGTLDRAKNAMPYGYVVKPFTENDLLTAIEIALHKHATELDHLSITKTKIDGIANKPLTKKEYEILLDITKGLSNIQLAEKHFISHNTVMSHMRSLLTKLEASNRSVALHKIITMLTGSHHKYSGA